MRERKASKAKIASSRTDMSPSSEPSSVSKSARRQPKTRRSLFLKNLRKYQDYRFRKNEEKIIKYYYEGDRWDAVKIFTKKTGVSRTTFYRHHRKIYEIRTDYEDFILYKFSQFLKNFEDYPLRGLYRRLLCFMVIENYFFRLLPKRCNDRVFREMTHKLKPKILDHTKLKEVAFQIYAGEVIELLRIWALDGCKEETIEKTLGNIMFLTDTASHRLNGLRE